MFGGSGVSSSWANQQQNQQPQQNAFAQPAAFGSNAFGSGAFGQPQQPQQQPQANPMFGSLGGAPSQAAPAFGAFGAPSTTANAGGFGQAKPSTGFGAFGGNSSTFGSSGGGAFGSTTTAPQSGASNPFGAQPQTNTSNTFGGGLFGSNKPTGFGAVVSSDSVPPVTTGTANPPYNALQEKDGTSPTVLHYQSITCMQAYRGSSFEELRWQDYQQGRKTAGAFSQPSFGAPATAQPSTGLFGQTAAQTAAPAANPIFGSFGGTAGSATGPSATGFGTFGQPANSNATATGGGLFGGGFNQQAQTQPQQNQQQPQGGAFGAFGQPQQNATGGLFGGGGAFGATQPKPAFGGTFGGGGNTFGQSQNPPQQQGSAGGLFGQPQQQASGNAFGAFGQNNNAAKPSIFGNPQPAAQQTSNFGAFGTQPQNQQAQQPGNQAAGGLFAGGGLFGQQNQQQAPLGQQQQTGAGGLFGSQAAQPPSGGGLFGGGSLFGNNQQQASQQQQQQQQQPQQPAQQNSFGLFGGLKPAASTTQPSGGGLFGGFAQSNPSNPASSQPTNMFGAPLGQQPNAQQGGNAFGGGLFGKSVAQPLGSSLSSMQQGAPLGGSIFGGPLGPSANTVNAGSAGLGGQGPLTASIAQPIGTSLPIFNMLPPGPRAVHLDQPKKKANYFVDIPTRSPVPRLQLSYADKGTRLRGFSSTGVSGANNALFSSSKPNALSLSKAKNSTGTEAFLSGGNSSSTLGSGGRHSVKKLVLDKKVEPSDLFTKTLNGGKVTFSPALSVAAREKEAQGMAGTAARELDSPSPLGRTQPRAINRFSAQSTQDLEVSSPLKIKTVAVNESQLQEGDYWMKPDLETLKKAGHEELMSLSGFMVGRVGYGQITFLDPVDLTNVPRLSGLLGELVRFDDKECSVYPDSDDAEKPPPGGGLNVRARIELVRCWALDKATREPIKDPKNAMAARHYKRLKNMKGTQFEGFDIEEGKWTFTVDYF